MRHAYGMIYAAEVNIIWQETNTKDTLILNLYVASAQLNLILLIAVWPKFSFPIFYGNITEDQLPWSHLAPWICNEKFTHLFSSSAQNQSFSIKHSKWQWMQPSPTVFSIHTCYKLGEKLSFHFAGFSRFRCAYELEVDHCISKKHSERNTLTTHLLIIVLMLLFLHFVLTVPFPFC